MEAVLLFLIIIKFIIIKIYVLCKAVWIKFLLFVLEAMK